MAEYINKEQQINDPTRGDAKLKGIPSTGQQQQQAQKEKEVSLKDITSHDPIADYNDWYYNNEFIEYQKALQYSHYDNLQDPYQEVKAPSDFGKSKYDKEIENYWQLNDINEVRAQNQSAVAQIGSGIGKFFTTASSTFLEGTLGTVWGVGAAINSAIEGDSAAVAWSKLWDNDVSRALHQFNQWTEELMPNYRTYEQQNAAWYDPTNLISANGVADMIKMAGFTVGAYYGGGVWTKALKGAGLLKHALAARVVGSTVGALGEASIEAINNMTDVANLGREQLIDATTRVLSEQGMDDIDAETLIDTLTPEKAEQLKQQLDADLEQYVPQASKEGYDPLAGANEALFRNLQKENERKKELIDSILQQKQDLRERIAQQGNIQYAANVAIVSAADLVAYGSLYARGFNEARKQMFKNGAKKTVVDAADELLRQKEDELAKSVVRDKAGHWIAKTTSTGKAIGRSVGKGLAEGLEEMNQSVAAGVAGKGVLSDDPDAFYRSLTDPDYQYKTANFLTNVGSSICNTYGNFDNYQEGFAAFIQTALFGIPTFGKVSNSGAETYLGRGKFIGMTGGIFGEIANTRDINERIEQSVRTMNAFEQKAKTASEFVNSMTAMSDAMDGYVEADDKFNYLNSRDNQMFAAIAAYGRMGKLADLKEIINQDFENFTDEELMQIAGYTSSSQKQGDTEVTGWRNVDGSFLPATEEGAQKMREKLTEKRDEILKQVDQYEKDVEWARMIVSDAAERSEQDTNEIAWLKWKTDQFVDRYGSVLKENQERITSLAASLKQRVEGNEFGDSELGQQIKSVTELTSKFLDIISENASKANTSKSKEDLLKLAAFLNTNQKIMELISGFSNDALMADSKGIYITVFDSVFRQSIDRTEFESLMKELKDMTVLVKSYESFSKRLDEYIKDPLKQQKNHNKITQQQEQKKKKQRDAKDFNDLIENYDQQESLEERIEKMSVFERDDLEEKLKAAQKEEGFSDEQYDRMERMLNDLAIDEGKRRLIEKIQALKEVSKGAKTDAVTLLNKVNVKKPKDLTNLDNYTDSSVLYDDTLSGITDENVIQKQLEDRLKIAKDVIQKAIDIIHKENKQKVPKNKQGGKTKSKKKTGHDGPEVNENENTTEGESTIEQDVNYIIENLVEDSTKLTADDKKELENAIKNAFDFTIQSNQSLEDVLKQFAGKSFNNVFIKYLNDQGEIVNVFKQAMLDHEFSSNNSEELTNDSEDSILEKESETYLTKSSKNGKKQYWIPIQSELPIHRTDKTSKTPYYQIAKSDSKLDPKVKNYIVTVGEYLAEHGAFKAVKEGFLKPGDKIELVVDKDLNTKAGIFIILMQTTSGQIVGSLPTSLDSTFSSYANLEEVTKQIILDYNAAIKKGEVEDGKVWKTTFTTSIDKWMTGKPSYSKEHQSVAEVAKQKNQEIYFAINTNDSVPNMVTRGDRRGESDPNIINPITAKKGQPFLLLHTGVNKEAKGRKYLPLPFLTQKYNKEETNKLFNQIVDFAINNLNKVTSSNAITTKTYLENLFAVKFGVHLRKSGKEIKLQYAVTNEEGETEWRTLYQGPKDNLDMEAIKDALSELPINVSLKYINQKFSFKNAEGQIVEVAYNDAIAEMATVNVDDLTTQSNFFTVKPLDKDGKSLKASSPKTTGKHSEDPVIKNDTIKKYTVTWNGIQHDVSVDSKFPKIVTVEGEVNKNYNSESRDVNEAQMAKKILAACYILEHKPKNNDTPYGIFDMDKFEFVTAKPKSKPKPKQPVENSIKEDNTGENGENQITRVDKPQELLNSIWEKLNALEKSDIVEYDIDVEEINKCWNRAKKTVDLERLRTLIDEATGNVVEGVFRKTTKKHFYKKWNQQREMTWLNKALPQLQAQDRVRIVNGLIKVSNDPNGETAWGKVKNGVMEISNNAAYGTVYHEAFHIVSDTLLTDSERSKLYSEAKKAYKTITEIETEEHLAEEFRKYMQWEQYPVIGTIVKFFRTLKHTVQTFFKNEPYINSVFYQIARGNYANKVLSNTLTQDKVTEISVKIVDLQNEIAQNNSIIDMDVEAQVQDIYDSYNEIKERFPNAIRMKRFATEYSSRKEAEEDGFKTSYSNIITVEEHNGKFYLAIPNNINKFVSDFRKQLNIDKLTAKKRNAEIEKQLSNLLKTQENIVTEEVEQTNSTSISISKIRNYYKNKFKYANLSQEVKDFLANKNISQKEYDELTLEEKEILLYCRI